MKKSELTKIIKEEIQKLLSESITMTNVELLKILKSCGYKLTEKEVIQNKIFKYWMTSGDFEKLKTTLKGKSTYTGADSISREPATLSGSNFNVKKKSQSDIYVELRKGKSDIYKMTQGVEGEDSEY